MAKGSSGRRRKTFAELLVLLRHVGNKDFMSRTAAIILAAVNPET
jgi:hypothetical protein